MCLRDAEMSAMPGDLLFFRHNEANPIVRFAFGDEFSHTGIVCHINNRPYVLEAVSEGDLCAIGDCQEGVKCTPLSERIASYDGYVSLKQLDTVLSDDRKVALANYALRSRACTFCSYTHDKSILAVVAKCALGRHHDMQDCTVCSAFVARALKCLRLLSAQKMDICDACFRPQTIHAMVDDPTSLASGIRYGETCDILNPYFYAHHSCASMC